MFVNERRINGKPEFSRKIKMSKVNISKDTNVDRDCRKILDTVVGVDVWICGCVKIKLIGESSTDTQLIPTHIYLHPCALAVATSHTHTLTHPKKNTTLRFLRYLELLHYILQHIHLMILLTVLQ
jgi:hypothetical protein